MPGPGPDQPGQALPGGTPHAVRGVPGHRTVTNPAQSSSERLTWPTSVVCPDRVDGNIEIPSGGTPQDVPIFHMAATFEKYNEPILRYYFGACEASQGPTGRVAQRRRVTVCTVGYVERRTIAHKHAEVRTK